MSGLKKITSGHADVIASGTVISFDESPLNIDFGNSSENLRLTLVFDRDSTNEFKLTAEPISQHELRLHIFNSQNSTLGSGLLAPVHIGSLDEKDIFISFRIYSLDNSEQRTVHYTIYEKNRT